MIVCIYPAVLLRSAIMIRWSIIVVIKVPSNTSTTVAAHVREGEATTGLVPHCFFDSVNDNILEFRSWEGKPEPSSLKLNVTCIEMRVLRWFSTTREISFIWKVQNKCFSPCENPKDRRNLIFFYLWKWQGDFLDLFFPKKQKGEKMISL